MTSILLCGLGALLVSCSAPARPSVPLAAPHEAAERAPAAARPAEVEPADGPQAHTIRVSPAGISYDGAPVCPPDVVCKAVEWSVLVRPLIEKVRAWRRSAPAEARLIVLLDPSVPDYTALGDVVGSLSNAGEWGFTLARTDEPAVRWRVGLAQGEGGDAPTFEQSPSMRLGGHGGFTVQSGNRDLGRGCEGPLAAQASQLSIDSDLAPCVSGLARTGPLRKITLRVRREVPASELFQVLEALGTGPFVGLLTPL
jgi:hypothetical protein